MRERLAVAFVAAVLAIATVAARAQVMTSLERRNPSAVSETVSVQIASEPLADGVLAYADRMHLYRNVPEALVGAEYVLTSNDDKNNPFHELHITIASAGTLYLIIDNRVGTSQKDAFLSPDVEAAGMLWVEEMGFVDTGMKMALDEHGDGTINNYYSVFSKPVSPGVIILKAQNDTSFGNPYDRNMYGVAAMGSGETTNPTPVGQSSDPTLMGWWKLDDDGADRASDSSPWERHGVLYGNPRWVPGRLGDALAFDGAGDYVDTNYQENLARWTVSAWVMSPQAPTHIGVGGPVHREANYQFNWNHHDGRFRGTAALRIGDIWHPASFGPLSAHRWYHLAATFDGASLNAYVDGDLITANPEAQGVPGYEPSTLKIGRHAGLSYFFTGSVDDVRIYNRALTQEEIENIMFWNPQVAQDPRPSRDGNVSIRDLSVVSWSPGENAALHDVYFGTDANVVEAADVNSPVYCDRQAETTFPIAGMVEIGVRYFWRIDEVEADGVTIHKGDVWSFTVSGYSIVEDFESYAVAEGRRIEETWTGGLVNGSGSDVSLWVAGPTTRAGAGRNRQAMSLAYDNTSSPFCSETARQFIPEQDWTIDLADTLCLSFKGDAISFGETAPGAYTMTASGTDIWSNVDECRYAFRRLDGDGSMSVRVDSFVLTDVWAKAGVMIRESLDPGSRHASMFVTPDGRRAFQNRLDEGSGFCYTAHSPPGSISLPYWVKIERKGNQFTAYHSREGTRWIKQSDSEDVVSYQSSNPQTVNMPATVYIGFVLSSHNSGLVTTATFSDVKTTGYVGSHWQVAEIGCDHPGNSPDDLYVIVQDSEGRTAAAINPDPTAVNAANWTEWRIPFRDLPGIDLHRVKKMCIGVGGRESAVPPGSGRILIDDILVWRP